MSGPLLLTPSGEIANFVDVDQFVKGRSLMTCGFCATRCCFGATQPGHPVTDTPAKIEQDTDAWYREYNGPDVTSNQNGMSLWQLYRLIVGKGGHFQATSLAMSVILAWVKLGYPVILAVHESSVVDLAVGGNPYHWDTTGLNHIIVATGQSARDNPLVRDSANVGRSGPREYDGARLQLLSATIFVPTWLPRPAGALPPLPPPVVLATSPDAFSENDLVEWARYTRDIGKPDVPHTTGIAKQWLHARWTAPYRNIGPPMGPEMINVYGGKRYAEQRFTDARASWAQDTGDCTWYDSRGSFKVM
jgi:hypothetical protein